MTDQILTASPPMPFKVYIISVDDNSTQVEAQYNPKELQVDKAVTWNKKDRATPSDQPMLEFSGGQGRTLSIELLFDGYEQQTDVHAKYVSKLLTLATIRNPKGTDAEKRPHRVKLVWADGKLPNFLGVIESVSTKYTMFSRDGTPVRATCNVKLKEADELSFKAPKNTP